MKKQVLILIVSLLAFALPLNAQDYDFSAVAPNGQTLFYKIVDGNAQVVSEYPAGEYTNSPGGDLIIPESVSYEGNSYSVTTMGEYAFAGCYDLTSVVIPNTMTNIGRLAFERCTGLTSVTIPTSVTTIGDGAFEICLSLPTIDLPNSVTSTGEWTFYRCSSLTSVNIPNTVTIIGHGAFYWCTGLTSVIIPNTVTTIGTEAFWHCSGLTSIECMAEVPPTVGYHVFDDVPTDIPVYVPCGKVADYQAADGWSGFTNIQEWAGCAHVYADGNDIVVDGAAGNAVTLYNNGGIQVASGTAPARFEGLTSGTYYVKIGVLPARMKVEVQ